MRHYRWRADASTRHQDVAMPPSLQVKQSAHRAFGRLIRLTLDSYIRLDLTPAEAATVSRALTAVREGRSIEREIYMSPIASDHEFAGTVLPHGVRISIAKAIVDLNWDGVDQLARDLLSPPLE
jgi:hypothetical protein